jgi:hypothetical protein
MAVGYKIYLHTNKDQPERLQWDEVWSMAGIVLHSYHPVERCLEPVRMNRNTAELSACFHPLAYADKIVVFND